MRYAVENVRTGELFGNHTYAEAVARVAAMMRNWLYKEKFRVVKLEG